MNTMNTMNIMNTTNATNASSRTRAHIQVAALVALVAGAPLSAGNALTNGSFETPGILGPYVESVGYSGVGHSAALGWGVFHNTEGTTITELVTSTVPGGGKFMLHVVTDGHANGIAQVFAPFDGGYACVDEQVTIYVVSGTVIIGAGNGGNTGPNAFADANGTFEVLAGDNAVCPANAFIIYSWFAGAEFYVDLASVEPFSCQGPPGDLDLNGIVDGADLAIMLGQWGPCPGCSGDLDGNGHVNGADLASLLGNWGECNPAP